MSKEALKLQSEKWLRTFALYEVDVPSYDEMIRAALNSGGDYSIMFAHHTSMRKYPR